MHPLMIGLSLALWSQITVSHGGDGMDMSMDGAMALGQGKMLPYLHFAPGDMLWFLGWVPQTTRSLFGACIGLFLLGLVERWITASRAVIEVHWDKRAQIVRRSFTSRCKATRTDAETTPRNHSIIDILTMHRLPPFILAHDLSRGIFQVVQSSIGFSFMLVVMTFQVSYILAIVAGLGVGEMLFGRFTDAAAHLP